MYIYMKTELIFIVVTCFFVMDAYHDGKYINMIKKGKKYYKMIGIAFAGLSTYLFLKKNPNQAGDFIKSASGVVSHMPVDTRPFADMLINNPKQPMGSKVKRSVSETKKKFIASNQDWKCAGCDAKLTAWFEIDHRVRLDRGGSNEVDNLVALCRNCHGKKTAMENM